MGIRKLLVVLLAIVMLAAVSVPTASAWDGGRHGRNAWGHRPVFHHRGGGCVGCAFVGGLVLGGVLGGVLAAPYYTPPPVFVAAPPYCRTRPGFWSRVPYSTYGGYISYQSVWVPPQTVCG
jgi:hypothetical protein